MKENALKMTRLIGRLARARAEQAHIALSNRSEEEVDRIVQIWIEGDIGQALAADSIEEARHELNLRLAYAEKDLQARGAEGGEE